MDSQSVKPNELIARALSAGFLAAFLLKFSQRFEYPWLREVLAAAGSFIIAWIAIWGIQLALRKGRKWEHRKGASSESNPAQIR